MFEKVNKVIEDRNFEIEDSINDAKMKSLEAEKLRDSFEKQLATLEKKGLEIMKEARVKADEQGKEIINDAQKKASEMMKNAAIEIEQEKLRALEDMKQEIGMLAILAAEKILEKQLDHQEQQAIIGKIIDEAGNATWQN